MLCPAWSSIVSILARCSAEIVSAAAAVASGITAELAYFVDLLTEHHTSITQASGQVEESTVGLRQLVAATHVALSSRSSKACMVSSSLPRSSSRK